MEFQVNTNQVILRHQDQVESGEYNVTECNFTFSSEFDGLTKKAVFTGEDGTAYLQTIVDNKCSIPSEILEVSQVVEIGVYAYDVENEELVLRYSPEPTQFYIHQGSYKEAQNSTPPTPSEIEQLQAQITTNANNIEELTGDVVDINTELATINNDIADIQAEQVTQNTNIQNNADDIAEINRSLGTINSDIHDIQGDISDIKAEQITQNGDIQTNANDILDIKEEQLTQNQNIQTNAQNISNETLNRQQADNNLQSQIDAITASSDVIDVLGTYQDLLNYDTSHVKANDIIKVLQDNTHENAISYYRWVITEHSGSWLYVGSEGPYYTIAQADILLNGKVDKVQGKELSSNDFTDNDKNQIEANQNAIAGIKNGTTINDFGAVETALENKENKSNKVTSISSSSTDTQYPSAKCVYDSQEEQDTEIEALQAENAELKQDITNMAKAMYKVDGQGTDITLENTSENKFVEFGLEGRTEQEQLSGKNLFNVNGEITQIGLHTTVINNEINIPNASGNPPSALLDYVNVEANKTYTIKFNLKQGKARVAFKLYDSNKQLINNNSISFTGMSYLEGYEGYYKDGNSVTITIPSGYDISYIRPLTIAMNDSVTNIYTNYQIEQGSTATSYEPYCGGVPSPNPDLPQQIKNVTGNSNVKIQNKNLAKTTDCNIEETNANYKCINGLIEINVSARNRCYDICGGIVTGEYLPTYANSNDYHLTGKDEATYKISFPDIEKAITGSVNTILSVFTNKRTIGCYIPATGSIYGTTSFTLQEEEYVKSIYIWINGANSNTNIKTHIQLEQGTTATSYVPHKEQNLPFTFAEGQRLMQGGELQDGGIYNTRRQIEITAENVDSLVSSISTAFNISAATIFKEDLGYENTWLSGIALINNYHEIKASGDEESGSFATNFNRFNLYIFDDRFTDLEKAKSLLIGTIIEIEQAEEEIIPYNETQQAQYDAIKEATSEDDITIISSESDELGFNMNVVAVADANKVIDSELQEIKSAVIALGGDLNV